MIDPSPSARNAAVWAGLGMVIGALAALIIGLSWVRSESGTRIHVLGSGQQLSVLIAHEHRSVLIVGGTNASALANALGRARPPLARTIDVVLVDPAAAQGVRDWARDLRAKQHFVLPHPEFEPTSESIQESFGIDLGDGVRVEIRLAGDKWRAAILAPSGEALVTPDTADDRPAVLITLDGKAVGGDPGSGSVTIAPAIRSLEPSASTALVRSGDVLTIDIGDDGLRMDKDALIRA